MFRRGEKPSQSAAEADRQALFEKLAQRPETVCPFLGLAGARADYSDEATDDHRCHAFGDPEPVSAEYQRNVCLQRGYANCPRYLRGVLVIPTDELEALRRPQQRVPPPPAPTRPIPRPPPTDGGDRRRIAAVALVLLLLLAAGGAGAWWMLAGPGSVARKTPSPIPSLSAEPSPSEAEATSTAGPTVAPTPGPQDTFIGWEVTVGAGNNVVFQVSADGQILAEQEQTFSGPSQGPVDRVVASNNLLHWRETEGALDGWSFIRGESGEFQIREVWGTPDGELRYLVLSEDET